MAGNKQFTVLSGAEVREGQALPEIAFFDEAGEPIDIGGGLPEGTPELLTDGVDTEQRSWSAKDIADFVAAQISAIQ